MAESKKEGTKGGSGEWKSWLKTQHSKTKIMASGPITSWQIDGEKVEAVTDFIFLGSKITVDGDSSHEIKWRLLHGRKVTTNLNHVLKSGDITLLTKVHLVKAMVYPAVTYRCESWTIKKKEGQMPKNWCFQIMVLVKTVESPLDYRRWNQSIIKGINPEYSLEGLMLNLCSHTLATWCQEPAH